MEDILLSLWIVLVATIFTGFYSGVTFLDVEILSSRAILKKISASKTKKTRCTTLLIIGSTILMGIVTLGSYFNGPSLNRPGYLSLIVMIGISIICYTDIKTKKFLEIDLGR